MNTIKRLNTKVVFTVSWLLVLSSCYVVKEYQRPELNTENLYRTDFLTDSATIAMDSTSLANISWRNLFTDPLLQGYIQQALNNNLDIRIALQSVEAAEAYVKQSKAAYYPTIDASLNYGLSKNSQNSALGQISDKAIGQFQLGANFSWEADIWKKIRSMERATAATYFQSIEAHRAIKTRLVASVASTYYLLAALSEQIEIAERSIASRDSSLVTTRTLKAAGQVTEVAVKQMEAQVYDAQLIRLNLQQQQRTLENAFCLLLNEPFHPVERNALSAQTIQTNLTTGVPALLLANRPDVMQAEYGLINAFELTNVAKSNFYPSLMISASGGLQSVHLKDWLSVNSLFANIAGNLLQPIFYKRQLKTAYEVAQIRQEQALLSYEKTLLIAGNEVSNALFDYHTQTEAIALEEKRTEALSKAVNYSEQLLVNGLANYLEVLTARQSVLATQLNLVNARYAQLNSIVNLYEALGGGWQ
ncbi:MAG: efflux transporter outer membrane subunit [Chitinophagaceae bacterium]|nr:efflux transporter outer membrane subunit [Chitinophagaceae bacterium]